MVTRDVRRFVEDWDRNQVIATGGANPNGWTLKKTAAGGAPTLQTISSDGGAVQCVLAATSEAEIMTLYQGDILFLPVGQGNLQLVEWLMEVAAIDAVTTLVFGVANAQNDVVNSITKCALFKILGSTSLTNIVIDARDGTNSFANIATGVTLAGVTKKFKIDFQNGLKDVRFYVDQQQVAAGQKFDLSNLAATDRFQPFVQLQKASGTGVPQYTSRLYDHQFKYAYGA